MGVDEGMPLARSYGAYLMLTKISCIDRICPGKDLAVRTLFIDIASLMWAFNIEAATDEGGKPILPSRLEMVDEGVVA